ncbi:MAG: helix-turn-helix domain-containing protein [Propionibacteriales bacterium]|nr:helix-turn-helix domain-containing protein [Propionibacteriales bacterium]
MIEFRLSLAALGNTRFGYSPLGEVASSLRALGTARGGPLLRPWLRDIGDSLRSVDLTLLRAAVPPGYVAPDFMFAWTTDPRTTLEDQLDELTRLPTESLQRDLDVVWAGRRRPPLVDSLHTDAGRQRLADELWKYWDLAIRPYWPRIRSTVDEDVAYRANKLLTGGLYDLLDDLHPEMSLTGEVLRIDKPHHPDAQFALPTLTLIPSVFVWPQLIVAHSSPGCFDLQYAARGVGRVWEGLANDSEADDALAALVGRTRAMILSKLTLAQSTTQLAIQLGQSPGSVSTHLSVLRRSGLVTSQRSGRSVLYRRTPLATSIVTAGESSGDMRGQLA